MFGVPIYDCTKMGGAWILSAGRLRPAQVPPQGMGKSRVQRSQEEHGSVSNMERAGCGSSSMCVREEDV